MPDSFIPDRPGAGPNRRRRLLTLASLASAACRPARAGQRAPAPDPTTPEASTPDALAHPAPLMLAGRYLPGQPVAGFLVSEKLDGVRARWDGARLWTRSGRPIEAPAGFSEGWPALPLDAELWCGRQQFKRAVAAVREGAASPAWAEVRLMVFDSPAWALRFGGPEGRLARLQALLGAGAGRLALLPQGTVPSPAALRARLDEVVSGGGEGLMLHRADGLYQAGRSPDLLKYKPYLDDEAQVLQILPGQGRFEGLAGALLVQTREGRRLRLGSGLTLAQRRDPPPVGSWVSYRYQGLHAGGTPRFARLLRALPDPTL